MTKYLEVIKCLVCGKRVPTSRADGSEIQHYLCSRECARKYESEYPISTMLDPHPPYNFCNANRCRYYDRKKDACKRGGWKTPVDFFVHCCRFYIPKAYKKNRRVA